MKRLFALILSAAALVFFLYPAADVHAQSKDKLTVWEFPYPGLDKIVKGILDPIAAKRGLEVEVVIIPWDAGDQMWTTAIASGQTPSMGEMYDARLPAYARTGGLEPLEGYFTSGDLKQFLPAHIKSLYEGQNLIGLPMCTYSDIMYYNKDLLAKAGIVVPQDPTYSPSWEEFVGWLKKLAAAGFYGWDAMGFRSIYDHDVDDFYFRFGSRYVNSDYSKMVFNSPDSLRAARALKMLHDTPNLQPPKAYTMGYVRSEAFLAGQAGFCDFWIGLAKRLDTEYPNFKWGVMRPWHEKERKAYFGWAAYSVFKDAKNKGKVLEVLKEWAKDPKLIATYAAGIGGFPPVQGGNNLVYQNASAQIKQAASAVWNNFTSGDAKFVYGWKGFNRWGDEVVVTNQQKMLLGQMSPEEFVRLCAEEGDKIIQEESGR